MSSFGVVESLPTSNNAIVIMIWFVQSTSKTPSQLRKTGAGFCDDSSTCSFSVVVVVVVVVVVGLST